MNPHLPSRLSHARAGGSVYLLVLATTTMVAVLGISGLMAARLQRVSTTLGADAAAAGHLARAGLAAAAHRYGHDPIWAANPATDWTGEVALGEGSFRTRATPDPDRPGCIRVRSRAVVGRSVRVVEAVLSEPKRLGPELLVNPAFESGFFPSEGRGADDAEITRLRTPRPVMEVDHRDDPEDGIQQPLQALLVPGARYRPSALVRSPERPDIVRVGLERGGGFLAPKTFTQAWVGSDWTEVSNEVPPPPGGSGGTVRFFVQTVNDDKKLQIERISLRRVLDRVAAEVVPGSLRWCADDDPPPDP